MSDLKIITNNHWHNFLYGYELTEEEKKEFDWLSEEEIETDTFFRYRGNCYSLSEFMRIPKGMFPSNWHGYHSDSFFSGILIEVSEDAETYKVGLYLS